MVTHDLLYVAREAAKGCVSAGSVGVQFIRFPRASRGPRGCAVEVTNGTLWSLQIATEKIRAATELFRAAWTEEIANAVKLSVAPTRPLWPAERHDASEFLTAHEAAAAWLAIVAEKIEQATQHAADELALGEFLCAQCRWETSCGPSTGAIDAEWAAAVGKLPADANRLISDEPGAESAETSEVFEGNSYPSNPDVADLCKAIKEKRPLGMS